MNIPHNCEAEEAVNGSLLLGGDINSISLSPEDFFSEQNKLIFQACLSLKGRGINEITPAHALGDNLKKAGGTAYISHLLIVTPTPYDLKYYADIVKELSIKRQLIGVAEKLTASVDDCNDLSKLLSNADDMLLSLRKKANVNEIVTPEDRVKLISDRYTKLYNNENGDAISTGLIDLDKQIGGGFFNGDLDFIAARPGVGKTAMMRTICNNIADRELICAFISIEMSSEALADRDIAGVVGQSINVVRQGNYTPELYAQILGEGLDTVGKRKIYELDNSFVTTDSIMQFCLSLDTRYGLDIVFIDYLGLLADESKENQNIRLGKISRKLKIMARKLNVPVVVAHQLSRAVEMRAEVDREPRLSDLRESGHLEEDADLVLFLHRENYYNKLTTDNTTGIIIAKQRQGDSNFRVNVYFDKRHQKYQNLVK